MSGWLMLPAGTAVLAFVTTFHCALALLRNYRAAKTARLSVLPSIVLTILPWFFPAYAWVLFGIAAHLTWFIVCERWLPAAPVQQIVAPPPQRSKGFQPLRVLATVEETPEIRAFRLARPEGFAFRPGQFVMVRVPVAGASLTRCYSITTAPETAGYFEIGVRNQGIVSRHLHDHVRAGMTLEVNGPGGAFVYPKGDRPIVLLAGGVGITPLLSMLRHGLAGEPSRPIALLFSARAQVPFLDELRVLERRHPQFRLVISQTRIDRALLETTVRHPAQCVYMICGPLPMIDAMRAHLEAMGVPAAQVHFEKFETAIAAAHGAPAARITLRRAKRTIAIAEEQSILEAAEGAGVSMPSLCRVGACGTCRVRLISGEVEGDFDALDPSEQAEGFILACVARARSDCVIDA